MIHTRYGCFETNSSSCHSIVLDGGGEGTYETVRRRPGDTEYELTVSTLFGWGVDTYTDIDRKLEYLLIDTVDDDIELPKDQIRESNCCPSQVPIFRVFKEWTGLDLVVEFTYDRLGYMDASIDHQSIGIGRDLVNTGAEAIKNFVFNPFSELVIDNDNH